MLIAVSLEILCPHCGEPQPDPEIGSHIWTIDQLRAANEQKRECVSCEQSFVIFSATKIAVA